MTITGDRIEYESKHVTDLSEQEAEIYQRAIRRIENALSIVAEIQGDRVNEAGGIDQPITRQEINTLDEINTEYLAPALAVLKALEEQKLLSER